MAENNGIPRDKRGRILPRMTRENLAEMMNLPTDASVRTCLTIAKRTIKHNPDLRYKLCRMCILDDNAYTGTLMREIKYRITA